MTAPVERCGVTSFWNGPLSHELVCDREPNHEGCHIAFLPRVSVAFTDSREDGIVQIATTK